MGNNIIQAAHVVQFKSEPYAVSLCIFGDPVLLLGPPFSSYMPGPHLGVSAARSALSTYGPKLSFLVPRARGFLCCLVPPDTGPGLGHDMRPRSW